MLTSSPGAAQVVSLLLHLVMYHMDALGNTALYLCKALPVAHWAVSSADMATLGTWLLEPPASVQHQCAKLILEGANWGRGCLPGGETGGLGRGLHAPRPTLLIPTRVHRAAAMAIMSAFLTHGPVHAQSTFAVQLASLLPPTATEAFGSWCWQVRGVFITAPCLARTDCG